MAIPDARTTAYISFFKNQSGGSMPVFKGLPRYQSGQGIGDIFRGIWRRVVPIALNVGKAALNAFTGAQDEGASFKDSFKATLRPVASAAISVQSMKSNECKERENLHPPLLHLK